MTYRELAILDALNIASTIHRRKRVYQATAVQITDVLNTDARIQGDPFVLAMLTLTPIQVGASLRSLASGWPRRREPLVEKINARNWALTDAGVRVLGA